MNNLPKITEIYRFQKQISKNSQFLKKFCLPKGTSGTRGLEVWAQALSGLANFPIFRAQAYRA